MLGFCRLLAANRIRSGESYVAGGAALNELLSSPRRSRDIDLFHDTVVALAGLGSRGLLATTKLSGPRFQPVHSRAQIA